MKKERRPLLTDRIAQVIIVVVFMSLFTPLAGNVMLLPLEETGVEVFPDTPPIETGLDYNQIWIVYPLMQAAYSSIILWIDENEFTSSVATGKGLSAQTSPLFAALTVPSPRGEGKENRRVGRGEVWRRIL